MTDPPEPPVSTGWRPANDLLFPSSVAAAEVTLGPDLPPIVMVVFDELPLASVRSADAATIDAERFPNLARLAGDGVGCGTRTPPPWRATRTKRCRHPDG